MAASPSIKVIKNTDWRGANHQWSNRYYLSSAVAPADSAHWTTLSDAVVNAEKLALSSATTIVQTYGYAAGSDVPVFSKVYSQGGSLTTTGKLVQAGEVAALVRYSTSARTSKNHPLYLFNYYHGVFVASIASPDALESGMKTALQTYATAWVNGFSDGTNVYPRGGPNGNIATGQLVEQYVTHRDFPRA